MRVYAYRRWLGTISATVVCNYIPEPSAGLLGAQSDEEGAKMTKAAG